jgi:hypothetical protein
LEDRIVPTNRQTKARAKAVRAAAAARHKAALKAHAGLVPEIESLRAEGMSYGQIAARLTEQGHTSRQGKRLLPISVWKILNRARKESKQ